MSSPSEAAPDSVVYRIHPSIGVARLGDSPDDFFVGPEVPGQVSAEPRKKNGRIVRQAARFRLFAYRREGGTLVLDREVLPGTAGVVSIRWTVHLANRKAAFFEFAGLKGEAGKYHAGGDVAPAPRRNVGDPADWEIDPGARSVSGAQAGPVRFDAASGGRFPVNAAGTAVVPSLGELRTDAEGRLLVLGGHGVSGSTVTPPAPLPSYANNPTWLDDVSDGPVTAEVIVTNGGATKSVPVERDGQAWCLVAPPDFAPEVTGVVTLYDVLVDMATRKLDLPQERVYSTELAWLGELNGELRGGALSLARYRPDYERDVFPLIERALQFRWVHQAAANAHSDIMTDPALADPGDGARALREQVFRRLREPARTGHPRRQHAAAARRRAVRGAPAGAPYAPVGGHEDAVRDPRALARRCIRPARRGPDARTRAHGRPHRDHPLGTRPGRSRGLRRRRVLSGHRGGLADAARGPLHRAVPRRPRRSEHVPRRRGRRSRGPLQPADGGAVAGRLHGLSPGGAQRCGRACRVQGLVGVVAVATSRRGARRREHRHGALDPRLRRPRLDGRQLGEARLRAARRHDGRVRPGAVTVHDLCIVGGGPAGAFLAVLARRAGRSVVLVHAGRDGKPRGETLSPEAFRLLSAAGVADVTALAHGIPGVGSVDGWSRPHAPVRRSAITSPWGQSWHVDRPRFDAALREAARQLGATVLTARVSGARPSRHGFQVTGPSLRLSCRALVDATGAAASVAASLGLRRTVVDRQYVVYADLARAKPEATLDFMSFEDGWAYACPRGGGTQVALVTDRDVLRDRGPAVTMARALRALGLPPPEGALPPLRAFCHVVQVVHGARPRGFAVVGDAAWTPDPLSGHGIARALASAARLAEGRASAEPTPRYELEEHLRFRAALMRSTPWPAAPYFCRRAAAALRVEEELDGDPLAMDAGAETRGGGAQRVREEGRRLADLAS